MERIELARGLAQRVPPRIGFRGTAAAVALIQIRTATETEPLAVLPALCERRHFQQPLFPHGWSDVQLPRTGMIRENVRIIFGGRIADRGEEEMNVAHDIDHDAGETPAALQLRGTGDGTAEVEAVIAGSRQPAFDPDAINRANVRFDPHRVIGRQVTFNLNGPRLQRTDVEGQHSH